MPNCHLPQVVLETKEGTKAPPDQKAIQPTPPTRLKPEYRTLAETLKDAGTSHFDWFPGGTGNPAKSVPLTLKGGDWEEITVELPAEGPLGIARLYVPKQPQPIEIDWIELVSKKRQQSDANWVLMAAPCAV